MHRILNNRIKYFLIATGFLLVAIWYASNDLFNPTEVLFHEVKKEDFIVTVSAQGEINASNWMDISGPSHPNIMGLDIKMFSILEMVPEGTFVKKGDFVARLDDSELRTKIESLLKESKKLEQELKGKKLDAELDVKKRVLAYEELVYLLDQATVKLDGSEYEPKLIQKKIAHEFETAKENLLIHEKSLEVSSLKTELAINELTEKIQQNTTLIQELNMLISDFVIISPGDGIVIPKKDWGGKKLAAGSKFSSHNAVIATLPESSQLISTTYLNELDIRSLRLGQYATVTAQAFPDVLMNGVVSSIATIGQNANNRNYKIYKVDVLIDEAPREIKPSLTTKNTIYLDTLYSSVLLPINTIYYDSTSYVISEKDEKINVIIKKALDNNVLINEDIPEGTRLILNNFNDI